MHIEKFTGLVKKRYLALLASMLLVTSCADPQSNEQGGENSVDSAPVIVAASACTALAGQQIAAEFIALPSNGALIHSAELVAADAEENINGEFCKVLGSIRPVDYTAPDIFFEVNLPSTWNSKTIQFGGGGLNGVLVTGLEHYAKQPETEQTPLARGYVTLGSDSGHQSDKFFDGSFYLNEEALDNYGHMQIKKVHDVALWLIEQRYGKLPDQNYFIGGSQGGHEGFDALQRYPDDYDGVVAGYPAHNVLMLHLSALHYARALAANDGKSWLNNDEIKLLVDEVYSRCDTLDAAADGIISNVAACQVATAELKLLSAENPLRCSFGLDTGSECLSDDQLQFLNTIDEPYDLGFSVFRDDEGNSVFPKWTPFEGSTFADGGMAILGEEGPESALQRSPGVETSGLAVARNVSMDVMEDFDPAAYAGRITDLTTRLSANSVELDNYRNNGGKLIFYHGAVDDFITMYSSVQYYQRLLTQYGQEQADSFVRFYTVPGMGHRSGVFNARMSMLDALESWVEQGVAPGELQAVDANDLSAGRTRPVCVYPQWPKYTGSGSLDEAGNFSCVTE